MKLEVSTVTMDQEHLVKRLHSGIIVSLEDVFEKNLTTLVDIENWIDKAGFPWITQLKLLPVEKMYTQGNKFLVIKSSQTPVGPMILWTVYKGSLGINGWYNLVFKESTNVLS